MYLFKNRSSVKGCKMGSICIWRLTCILILCSSSGVYSITVASPTPKDVQNFGGPVIMPQQSELTLRKGQNFTLFCKGHRPVELKQQEMMEDMIESESFGMNWRNMSLYNETYYKYGIALDLYNVNQYASGYYACFDDSLNEDTILNYTDEPNNTEHVTYINIYVDDIEDMNGTVIIPSQSDIILQKGQNFTILCKGNYPVELLHEVLPKNALANTQFYTSLRNMVVSNDTYKYVVALDLYNVDEYASGYYACFDNNIDATDILENLVDEPNNTDHITYLYVFVDGTDSLFVPLTEIRPLRKGFNVVNCRPTTPDVTVTLIRVVNEGNNINAKYRLYSPKVGFTLGSHALENVVNPIFSCNFQRRNFNPEKTHIVFIELLVNRLPIPQITSESRYFISGETFSLNCTVTYNGDPILLSWETPFEGNITEVTNENDFIDEFIILYKNITIVNATKENEGRYVCKAKSINNTERKTIDKEYLPKGFVDVNPKYQKVESRRNVVTLHTIAKYYPKANVVFLKNGVELPNNKSKYKTIVNTKSNSADLIIYNVTINDMGNYTLVASNKYDTVNATIDFRPKVIPVIAFDVDRIYLYNSEATLKCVAKGFPLPNIEWTFSDNLGVIEQGTDKVISLNTMVSIFKLPALATRNVTCRANNTLGQQNITNLFLVNEVPSGFGVADTEEKWYSEKQNVEIKCYASKYEFVNVTWALSEDDIFHVNYYESLLSYIAVLQIDGISLDAEGNYTCIGYKMDHTEDRQTIFITVAEQRSPVIIEPKKEVEIQVIPYLSTQFMCAAEAVPPPEITWYKNNELITNDSSVTIFSDYFEKSNVNSTVYIKQMQEDNIGKYECVATSGDDSQKRIFNVVLKEKRTPLTTIYSVMGAILLVMMILIIYMARKIRKNKQLKRDLTAAGLWDFKKGATKSLNPDWGINDQAELLPYNDRFEFPVEKLILGKQLGAGAFGVVYKAEARGISDAEETTIVAVKMVKKTADNMYIKALASELKIMVHLGKHINIVNLLGACTTNVGKRELIVIVEYCEFGNILNYMQRHRHVFIDQLTDNKEKNLGKVNQGFSYSGGSGMPSDYFGSNQTQETDHTFVNTANTSRSSRKVSETGYVQPEWGSTYVGDYNYEGRSPRPLFSRDLLAWAYQIACGMEYLASRKVLHGDLAARNVLLAKDNIVKICDFGLAKSIYKNDEYQKKGNSPLPIKWLAIECMTDKIFSTQSDVWSFGIVLWEMFSLGKTPYPAFTATELLQWLTNGNRLQKPPYADDRLHEVMLQCWEKEPMERPSFSRLQETLGSFLDDNVRNHYVHLNSVYMKNNKTQAEEDYLAMVCAPDYTNLVTPRLHDYVNEPNHLFPPTPQPLHDDEGYLQMSPLSQQTKFSPRAPSTKFDFDNRKLNNRVTDANTQGSELTPMLTLNNLPARSGSESDVDGNNSSPYLNMCQRIEEENDDVFETKQNNQKNIQNSAVTNPTYITYDVDLEKKPQNISNNYININMPNGLVK